jgi:hypothetical protein
MPRRLEKSSGIEKGPAMADHNSNDCLWHCEIDCKEGFSSNFLLKKTFKKGLL